MEEHFENKSYEQIIRAKYGSTLFNPFCGLELWTELWVRIVSSNLCLKFLSPIMGSNFDLELLTLIVNLNYWFELLADVFDMDGACEISSETLWLCL